RSVTARTVLASPIRQASIERRARRKVGLDAADDVPEPRAEWLAGFDADLAVSLRGLLEPQRSVIEVRVLEGRPYDEVARTLEITPGAARVRTHRGLAALRLSLAPREPAFPVTRVAPAVQPKETIR